MIFFFTSSTPIYSKLKELLAKTWPVYFFFTSLFFSLSIITGDFLTDPDGQEVSCRPDSLPEFNLLE